MKFPLRFQEVEDDRPDPDACSEEPEGETADAGFHIEHRAWNVMGKELLVEVEQDDTDTPVRPV